VSDTTKVPQPPRSETRQSKPTSHRAVLIRFDRLGIGYTPTVIILGLILLILGIILNVGILTTLGVILLIVGVVLYILGATGRAVGGRSHYF
jgi:hypothetical protein